MMTEPDLDPGPTQFGTIALHRRGRLMLQALRWIVPVMLLAYVGYRLNQLGWHRIWNARPASIGFYLLIVLQFFIQPLGDLIIYRNLWGPGKALGLSIFLRKRFLNSALFDYSGEVFFYFWAQRRLKLPNGMLVHAIKDSNLLSGGAGLAMVWLVLLALLATGGLQIPQIVAAHSWIYVLVGSLPLLFCAILVIAHRKVTVLSRRQIAETFSVHFLRSLLVLLLEIGFWELSGALPSAVACLQFVAMRLVISRLPLVPNKDLVFVGAGIAAAGLMKVPVAPVATVLVILAAADLMLGSLLAGLPWAIDNFLSGRKANQSAA
jgi:hypothetical protein